MVAINDMLFGAVTIMNDTPRAPTFELYVFQDRYDRFWGRLSISDAPPQFILLSVSDMQTFGSIIERSVRSPP